MDMRKIAKAAVVAGLLLLLSTVHGGVLDDMEKALMPGELSQAHAKFEDDCTVCHKFFGKTQQNNLCVGCHDHKNIAEDIRQKRGYHGRIPGISAIAEDQVRECRVCHSEHKGRAHSIVLLDKQTFDHRLTDFVLRGRHRDASCESCHRPKKAYHQAPARCISCHKENDVHKAQLGERCGSCHGETRWQDFRFDHAATKFALEGKHKGVECRNCHPQQRYSGVPTKCQSCHQRDDKHQGRYGKQCKDCHSVNGWGSQRFDHDKDTKYPLKGRHAQTSCVQCHRPTDKTKKLKTDCYSCHRLQDEHKGQYGRKCKSCHTPRDWNKTKFEHDKTDFPLKGRHSDVACGDCHQGELGKEKLKTRCIACHRQDDVHHEQQGKRCQECHNEQGWQEKVNFDHNLVKFPLLGAHAALACEECHSSGKYKETKAQCLSCHKEDDMHRGSLGERCDRCHLVSDWKVWEFDHDRQTDFDLTGAHKGIVCSACHHDPAGKEVSLPSDCQSCHLQDDAHDGEFGRHCQRCHGTESFRDVRM
jgi:hypothetical protein